MPHGMNEPRVRKRTEIQLPLVTEEVVSAPDLLESPARLAQRGRDQRLHEKTAKGPLQADSLRRFDIREDRTQGPQVFPEHVSPERPKGCGLPLGSRLARQLPQPYDAN